ncbi:hypothetical protein PGT21_023458 [Puccinia graminis f. sp. tritici]|uniref:Uncharacterized protein n=1 Tax=Puccinia graminis f. sp. tritici TaxID=56615 RepID=A0A5B0PU57_PUCGR|nr:hypothetical protein PGTUg99_026911 [Puccinia graminis f. sp. tritici]KAA1104436.1 hypothetical protein PGT21_023458 [Puccinia graminis f. sp. tritici]
MAQSSKLTTGLFFCLAGVVNKCLGVGWGEETLFLLPRRSHRSTQISSPPPTNSPPNQPSTSTTQPYPGFPTKALAPTKDTANGLQPSNAAAEVPAAELSKDPAEAAADGPQPLKVTAEDTSDRPQPPRVTADGPEPPKVTAGAAEGHRRRARARTAGRHRSRNPRRSHGSRRGSRRGGSGSCRARDGSRQHRCGGGSAPWSKLWPVCLGHAECLRR